MTETLQPINETKHQLLDELTIKFAGDSGDGIQLTGQRFAELSSQVGEVVRTMPDFPAEIRAPAGTIGGVSGFQIRTGSDNVHTHGDRLDVLVAMNPASLKSNLAKVKRNGIILVNQDTFSERNLALADYQTSPLVDESLQDYRVFALSITKLTRAALKGSGLSGKEMDRAKNFFALGLICWLFPKPKTAVYQWIDKKFATKTVFAQANRKAFDTGWNYGETAELFATPYEIKKATKLKVDHTSKNQFITGNAAAASALVCAARKAGLPLFLGGYPITPATEVMQELLKIKAPDVKVFQAEDEIAAIGSTVGAAFAGALAATSTSGPGLALMGEFINLAVIAELPLVIINVQRAGPSTGLPTKTEQSDLMQALWGRNGESPLPILAAKTPQDCFNMTYEAARLAIHYMTPVIVLSDLYLSASAEAWHEPEQQELAEIPVHFATQAEGFKPYQRNDDTLARPWAIPGTPGLEHITGGLEKQWDTGGVSYDGENHERMVHLRAQKIANIAKTLPLPPVYGNPNASVLLIGWGSTFGSLLEATEQMNQQGDAVAFIHLQHLNPFPKGLAESIRQYSKVVVAENNLGQLCQMLRAQFLIDAQLISKVQGSPFTVDEVILKLKLMMEKSS